MRTRAALACAVLALLAAPAWPGDLWPPPDGAPIPDTPARKTKNGLGVWLLVTDDPDWQRKWASPAAVVPRFHEANVVSTGGVLTVLTFVANARPDRAQHFDVTASITITRPNGTRSVDARDVPCLRGPAAPAPRVVALCEAVVQFSADPGDPTGVWAVDVRVRDANRDTEVPVSTSFTVRP